MPRDNVDVNTVVCIESVVLAKTSRGKRETRYRIEWGLRWESTPRFTGWVVSQRTTARDDEGIKLGRWVDLFNVMLGPRAFARTWIMQWVYGRADQIVYGDDDGGLGVDVIKPWEYRIGETRSQRLGRGVEWSTADSGVTTKSYKL